MKLSNLVVVTVLGLAVVSCSQGQLKTKKSLSSKIDSVSYALGANFGQQMRGDANEIDKNLFVQGYLNGRDSSNLLIEIKDLKNVINEYFRKKQAEQMEKAQKEQEKRALEQFGDYKKENEQFLVENKTKDGVKTTESGLQYIVLKEGTGETPNASSTVKVHYKGTSIKGEEFDSSYKRNQPAEFGVGQVIKGWTEGLQLMRVGGKYKFFIPQELAYGARQTSEIIKPFSTLVFEVELLEVK